MCSAEPNHLHSGVPNKLELLKCPPPKKTANYSKKQTLYLSWPIRFRPILALFFSTFRTLKAKCCPAVTGWLENKCNVPKKKSFLPPIKSLLVFINLMWFDAQPQDPKAYVTPGCADGAHLHSPAPHSSTPVSSATRLFANLRPLVLNHIVGNPSRH